jgi:hypothetical protein
MALYRALDETLHREVAIKILNAELNDPKSHAVSCRSGDRRPSQSPRHATGLRAVPARRQWLMVMEFVRGETLERMVDRLARCRRNAPPISRCRR